MTEAGSRLQEIFRENSVHNLLQLSDLSTEARDRLDACVYGWFAFFKEVHIRTLDDGFNLCLAIGSNIEDGLVGDPLDIVIKKLAFYSSTGVLLTPKFRQRGRGKLIPDAWYYLAIGYMPVVLVACSQLRGNTRCLGSACRDPFDGT